MKLDGLFYEVCRPMPVDTEFVGSTWEDEPDDPRSFSIDEIKYATNADLAFSAVKGTGCYISFLKETEGSLLAGEAPIRESIEEFHQRVAQEGKPGQFIKFTSHSEMGGTDDGSVCIIANIDYLILDSVNSIDEDNPAKGTRITLKDVGRSLWVTESIETVKSRLRSNSASPVADTEPSQAPHL